MREKGGGRETERETKSEEQYIFITTLELRTKNVWISFSLSLEPLLINQQKQNDNIIISQNILILQFFEMAKATDFIYPKSYL